jgi:hypothetical protein
MKPRVLLYCLLGGLPMSIAAMGVGHFGWWWVSGITLAAAFVPVALFGPRRPLSQLGVILPALLITTVFCTWTEAMLFMPSFSQHAVRDLAGSAVMYTFVAVVLAALVWVFKLGREDAPRVEHRSVFVAPLMVLLGGVAYMVYYGIFGAITYQFFTKGYYPEAAQQAQALGLWFWGIQITRGALMTLAVLPVIYTLRMPRWKAAIVVGALIWIAGGLAPLLVPNTFMGTTQRIIHIVEIFTQNFSLGATAVLLLRPKAPKRAPEVAAVAA